MLFYCSKSYKTMKISRSVFDPLPPCRSFPERRRWTVGVRARRFCQLKKPQRIFFNSISLSSSQLLLHPNHHWHNTPSQPPFTINDYFHSCRLVLCQARVIKSRSRTRGFPWESASLFVVGMHVPSYQDSSSHLRFLYTIAVVTLTC